MLVISNLFKFIYYYFKFLVMEFDKLQSNMSLFIYFIDLIANFNVLSSQGPLKKWSSLAFYLIPHWNNAQLKVFWLTGANFDRYIFQEVRWQKQIERVVDRFIVETRRTSRDHISLWNVAHLFKKKIFDKTLKKMATAILPIPL